jgi:hypothetical protein
MNKLATFFYIALGICIGSENLVITYKYHTHLQTQLGSFQAGQNIIQVTYNNNSLTDIGPKNQSEIHLISQSTITNKFIKSFYSIEDSISMHMYANMSLISIYKSIKEKRKPLKIYSSIINQDSIAYTKIVDTVKTLRKIKAPTESVYDALGIIFSFQNCSFTQSSEYNFNEYRKGKIKPLTLGVINEEIAVSPYGNSNCIVLSSNPENNSIDKGDIKIWISKQEEDWGIPIKVETQTKNGLLTLLLESIE